MIGILKRLVRFISAQMGAHDEVAATACICPECGRVIAEGEMAVRDGEDLVHAVCYSRVTAW